MPQLNKTGPDGRGKEARAFVKSARRRVTDKPGRLQEALAIARETGLLKGARTKLLRGRMPTALVAKAKERSGAVSDTELIEVALAALAVADEYPTWLLSRRGTVSKDLDFEF